MSKAGDKVVFFGDPHGEFGQVRRAVREGAPRNAFFVGDFDLDRPVDQELSDLVMAGSSIHFIHGNHDADRESWFDFLFNSNSAARVISSRVVEVNGFKVAGLGGVFHEDVWHPANGDGSPLFTSRENYMQVHGRKAWRGGLPLRHRSSIFPEDFNELAMQEADILVSHEAPSSHKYGHAVIDELAEVMGVKVIVHGHLHHRYEATLSNGIKVIGLGKADMLQTTFESLTS